MNNTTTVKALSIYDLTLMKQRGEKISCLTAYDASFSTLLDQVGIDVLLVGDSLGMTIKGCKTTLSVKCHEMAYHTRCVSHARRRAFVIADLPFMSYVTPLIAAKNAAKLMRAGAQMVKLEGARVEVVNFLMEQGIPVCGHLGLLPQFINQVGYYRVQGKEPNEAVQMINDAHALEKAGVGLLILECVPASLAKEIAHQLTIPVIGIGAGIDCDGQILVLYDMLNISVGKHPRFSKDFMQDVGGIQEAIEAYHDAVKQLQFPDDEHSF